MSRRHRSPFLLPLLFFVLILAPPSVTAPTVFAQARGPLLRITPDPVFFDTVSCGGVRCLDITLRNAGDTTLTIQEFDAPLPPFTGAAPAPMTLAPGAGHTFRWCYEPSRVRARDSLRVRFISDNRIPYSFGVLVDAGERMRAAFSGAESGIAAAHDALGDFIATMMADGAPSHEAAVFAYSASSQFRLLRGLTEQRALVVGSLPATASGTHSCVWHGMDRALTLLPGAQHRRVLLVINASEDAGLAECGPYSAPGVASAALASDVMVCAISLNGAAGTALASITAQTGGLYRDVTSMVEFRQAMVDLTQHLQRAVRQSVLLLGEVVSPALAIMPEAVLFPVTAASDTTHARVWLRNIGTAPMEMQTVTGQTPEFTSSFTPRPVAPGDSIPMDIRYHPTGQSYHNTTIPVTINGCEPSPPTLTLHGLSYLPVNPDPGAVLAKGPARIDGGEIRCDVGGAIDIPLRNAGSGVLQVFDPVVRCHALGITGAAMWELAAGESGILRTNTITGLPPGEDSCEVLVRTRGRVTTSTAVILDASSSLRAPWQGLDGTDAARLALGALLADMSATDVLHDRLLVLRAAGDTAETLLPATADRKAIAALAPVSTGGDTSAVLGTIAAALDSLDGAPGIRRLVLLTAGGYDAATADGFPDPDSLAARARGVRITVVHLGARPLSPPLQAFLVASGADIRTPVLPVNVVGEIRNLGQAAIDTLRHAWWVHWKTLSSDPAVAPDTVVFDRSIVGVADCRDLVVTNIGDAPLRIDRITSTAPGFTCESALPVEIPVGAVAALSLCHTPVALGPWSIEATLWSNSCVQGSITVSLRGDATDSNTVRIAGAYVARPGGLVTIPVLFDHALPASSDVRRMTLRIAYEPSVLYPDVEEPLRIAAGAGRPHTLTMTQEFDEDRGRAVTRYDIIAPAETPLTSSGSTHAFGTLRLRAYLGRVMTTDIELLDADFPDHAVALGYTGAATLRLDSMRWLDQRLIDASALWGVLGKVAPNPIRDRGTVAFTLHQARPIRLALYDLHGRLRRVVAEGPRPAGAQEVVVETHGLPAGVYALRLECDAGAVVRLMLVNTQEVTR
ncbi:MAG: DUF1573 domain-containing protein [Bacteroidota bacterium]|jgi:hypothetical protein|nr:DUF1573 domain-containing protein [Bacteroidota bacterium]